MLSIKPKVKTVPLIWEVRGWYNILTVTQFLSMKLQQCKGMEEWLKGVSPTAPATCSCICAPETKLASFLSSAFRA